MNKRELENMFAISLLIFAVAMFGDATPLIEEEPKWHFPGHDFDRTPLGDAVDLASMKMLHESFKQADDKNVVTSPLGVLLLLSMYSAGAGETIKEEIVKALGANNYEELYKSYSRLSDKFSAVDPNALTLANKVYVSDAYNLAEDFANGAVRSYHSEIERINFSDAKQAVATINRWGEEKTKGHIKSAFSEDAIDDSVVAALVNVIFFQGHWNVPFNATQTQEKDFHVDKSNVVKKQMMHLEDSLFYHESSELGAKMIELPYKETNFRMVVVLPDEIDGLPSVLEKVSQKGLLKEVFELSPAGREVHLDMPKFEIQSSLDLNNILPKVGVEKIFTHPASGIVREAPVKVSKAFQKAFVKVDEEGATAGAFTGFVVVNYSSSSVTPAMNFIVDHPFLFAILHEDSVLFAGTYSH